MNEKNSGKKFDICLMNPPYDNGLHEKFLEKTLDLADKIVTVQPLSWLIAKKQNKRITSKIDGNYAKIEIIDANNYFDASIPGTCSINYIINEPKNTIIYNGQTYTKCEDIKIYSHDNCLVSFANITQPVFISLWDKIKDTEPYIHKEEKNPNENWWCLKISKLQSNKGDNGAFYSIISADDSFVKSKANYGQYKDIKLIPNRKGKYQFMYFAFDTKIELDNFINYIKTDFVRACLMLTKTNGNMHRGCLSSIPWQDFSDPVFSRSPKEIDDYLFAKYGVSEEVRQHISEILPDYYNIR